SLLALSSVLFRYTTLFRSGLRPHPEPSAKLYAGNRRHHPIEDQQVGRAFPHPDLGLVAARDDLDLIAFSLQIVAQQYAQRLLVRSEEHTSELQSRENLVCR